MITPIPIVNRTSIKSEPFEVKSKQIQMIIPRIAEAYPYLNLKTGSNCLVARLNLMSAAETIRKITTLLITLIDRAYTNVPLIETRIVTAVKAIRLMYGTPVPGCSFEKATGK